MGEINQIIDSETMSGYKDEKHTVNKEENGER